MISSRFLSFEIINSCIDQYNLPYHGATRFRQTKYLAANVTLINQRGLDGFVPSIGANINNVDCNLNSCDLSCQTISFEDTETPVFSDVAENEIFACLDNVPPLSDLIWTDNCDGKGTATGSEIINVEVCTGDLIVRNWIYTDVCGNTTNHSQNITIEAAPPPAFDNLPSNLTVDCSNIPSDGLDLSYSYNGSCIGSGMVTATVDNNYDACGGFITRTWQLTDQCGNTIDHIQTITINPAPSPVFDLPPQGTIINCDEDYPMVSLAYNNGSTGVCEISGNVTGIDVSNGLPCEEEIIRTWTYTDPCGNTITESEVILSVDEEAPVMGEGAFFKPCTFWLQVYAAIL